MNSTRNWLLKVIAGQENGVTAQILRWLLFILSSVYRLTIRIRNWAFDNHWLQVHRIHSPVIAVGNLTTGGTGKTPVVKWLIDQLQEKYSVAVVSRGYRKQADKLNDEGQEIAVSFPDVIQIQDKDRVAAAQAALEKLTSKSDCQPVIVADDAFQHRRLHRDLNILVVDATQPFGHRYLLPRGLLREPIAGASRADAIVLTRANLVNESTRNQIRNQLQRWAPSARWAETQLICHRWLGTADQTTAFNSLRGKKLLAFCGIGNPQGFRQTLKNENMSVNSLIAFADHHHYSDTDLQNIFAAATRQNCDAIVCTMKDWVKLPAASNLNIPIYALETRMEILSGETELLALIHQQIEASTELKNTR